MVAHPSHDHEGHELVRGTSEDRDLTLAFQRGEKGAYQAIHDRHASRVEAVCRRILMNPDDAAEASQETFLRVYQALGRFNGRYQLGGWITRIATNVCLDHLRARSRKGGSDLMALELADLEHAELDDDGPEEVVVRRSEGYRVRKVLESLPPLHRAAIALRDFEGLSYEEVANALDISVPQVKALLHRARQKFKRSWLSEIASIFVPWRLLDRLRTPESALREPATGQAASFVAHSAPVCSSALQQCGQYLVDKVAPVLTVAVIGATTAGSVTTPAASAREEKPVRPVEHRDSPAFWREPNLPVEDRTPEIDRRDRPTTSTESVRPTQSSETSSGEPAPQPTPTPSATPAPGSTSQGGTTGGSAGGGQTQGGTASGSTAFPTPPFTIAAGFERGPLAFAAPTTYSGTLNCAGAFMDQRITTAMQDGERSYPVEFSVHWRPSGLTVWTKITKDGYVVSYPGAAYVQRLQKVGRYTEITFEGTYGTHPSAAAAGLPDNGHLRVEMSLDCAASSVVHQALTFSVQSNDDGAS